MFKCFCITEIITLFVSIGIFILAYIFYRLFLAIFPRFFHQKEQGKRFVKTIKHPLLLITLEIAAVISFYLFEFDEPYKQLIRHGITVIIIATIGWFIGGLTSAFYQAFLEKVEGGDTRDLSRRSLLTQVFFFYRVVMFSIVVLTLSAILITFPYIRSLGVGILGSAGIAGLALGIAARPLLLNLMAGFQITMTKMLKIGDAVQIEGEVSIIESLHLMHIIARTWDLRRFVVPISYFIDKPFQNWDAESSELIASTLFYCDYTLPVNAIREKVKEIIEKTPLWNRKTWSVHVTNMTQQTIEIRAIMSADDAASAFELRAHVREKVVEFLQKEYPQALPCFRQFKVSEGVNDIPSSRL